jgi:hypothetical protein
MRVKALRRELLETWLDEQKPDADRRTARAALDDVHLVLQLYSYPGNYLAEAPTLERMAETIEKFEEDLDGMAYPKGRRRAKVVFGKPIDLSTHVEATKLRAATAKLTSRLESDIQGLMSELSAW